MSHVSDLCETFRSQSGLVWNRMAKASRVGLALSEETLTETALYEMALAHELDGKIAISLATKPQEARHGADWEWWLINGNMGVSFRVQAKRLFPNGRYQSLLKGPPDPYQQLNRLCRAARRDGHVPLYCFFNFDHPAASFDGWDGRCLHSYRAPSFWGCAFALPNGVLAATSNRLRDLRSYTRPWHKLVCNEESVGLRGAGIGFVHEMYRLAPLGTAGLDPVVARPVPEHVLRLIQMKRARSDQPDAPFLDGAYWEERSEVPEDIAGLVVFEDRAD